MKELPMPVAVAALVDDGSILLLKRTRGDYVGFWSLPGGKIEKGEHPSDAAVREIREETGLPTTFRRHLGLVSEHLKEDGVVAAHFLLHLCELELQDTNATPSDEGALAWFDLADLAAHEREIIPSDYLMIQRMVCRRGENYFNCVIEKAGDTHTLVSFA